MQRRKFLKTMGFATVSVGSLGVLKTTIAAKPKIKKAVTAKVSKEKPNFLIFCTDQQRAEHLGCAGNSVLNTPNIDQIAREGVRFNSCYCNSPACMPARATMFTGATNRVHGSRTNGVGMPNDTSTIPSLLADAGYRTHAVGKLHLSPWARPTGVDMCDIETPQKNPERLIHWENGSIKKSPNNYFGFQTMDMALGHVDYINGDYKVWLDKNYPGAYKGYKPAGYKKHKRVGDLGIKPELHYNNWIADKTIDFLEPQSKTDQPFFVWCSFPDPHAPFAAVKKWADEYRKVKIEIPTNALDVDLKKQSETMRVQGWVKQYDAEYLNEITIQTYGMLSHVDEQVGRVLEALKKNGQDKNTVVIFISDHGEQLGQHGLMHKANYPYEGHAKVPFICKVPWSNQKNVVIDQPVSQIDLLPTVLDIANLPQPDDDLVNDKFRKECGELVRPLPGESLKPVLLEGKKPERANALIEFDFENHPKFDLIQYRMLVTEKYQMTYYSPTQEIILFDRQKDPLQLNNLAEKPKYKDIINELFKIMLKQISRTEPRLPRRLSNY